MNRPITAMTPKETRRLGPSAKTGDDNGRRCFLGTEWILYLGSSCGDGIGVRNWRKGRRNGELGGMELGYGNKEGGRQGGGKAKNLLLWF